MRYWWYCYMGIMISPYEDPYSPTITTHRIHGTGISSYIYHNTQPVDVGKYTSPMDPMHNGMSFQGFVAVAPLSSHTRCCFISFMSGQKHPPFWTHSESIGDIEWDLSWGDSKQAANVLYVLRDQTLKSALFRLVVKGPLSRVVEQRLRV